MLRVAFITVGDPARRTGGYLYHARVFAELRAAGLTLDEIVASDASLTAQLSRAPMFGAGFEPGAYDVVVVDALARAVCAPWLDRWRALVPLVAMVHELPSVAADAPGEAEAEAPLLRADLLIAVSDHGRALLIERGVPRERIRVVPPGRDRLPAPAARSDAASSPLRVLSVAQWIARKGIVTLVEAWASRPRPGAVLELIGETTADLAYEREVRAAVALAPADSPILVRGLVSDKELAAAYRAAALFALPSTYEGYGMAYAEALSHGLPVIACAVGPVPDVVGAGGLLVPPDSPDALARAIGRVLDDAGLRARLARAALAQAQALPTWQDAARGVQRVLLEAASLRR